MLEEEVETLEIVNNKIIAKRFIEDGFRGYYDYAVYYMNGSKFLDFDYSNIEYSDGYWYLEKYNSEFSKHTKAVMDENKNFIVPFENNYDLLSDFSGGYAIGQTGSKDSNSTAYRPFVEKLFKTIKANNQKFSLEIINEDGKVVSDLTTQFKSAVLLGEDAGEIKVLVENDDGYQMATLNEKQNAIKIRKAINKVQNAEKNRTIQSIGEAKALVEALSENEYKISLNSRIDKIITLEDETSKISDAIIKVYSAETSKTDEDKLNAIALVRELPESDTKINLLGRLNKIVTPAELKNMKTSAENKVAIAEEIKTNKLKQDAQSIVGMLQEGDLKNSLQDRINNIVTIEELAVLKVEEAELLKTKNILESAHDLVNNLPKSRIKSNLERRLAEIYIEDEVIKPNPPTQSIPIIPNVPIEDLVSVLDGTNNVSDDEFIEIITKTNNDNKEFIDQLTNEQVEIYEARIRNVFKDNLIINQTNSKLNYTVKGIGLVPKIEDLVDNKKVEFKLEITDKFNENDKNVFNKYLEDLDITLKRQYPLEINLTQSVNTITSKITDMQRELSFTFPIPKDFMGIKDLDVIRIHDSKIDIIPAILNKDNTFTFKTDKLSTFILIEELHLEDNKFTSLERLGGINRIDTAALVSKKAYDRADNIVLTGISGEVDALTGTMLASYLDAPILFTDKNSLSKITETELTRLSAKNIYILGGRAVVSDSVVSKLSELGLKVERISGANRYETAAKIAEKPILTNTNHVFLASGLEDKNGTLADALTVGPASAKITSPVLLTQTNQLTTETKRALINLKVKEVTIIGGQSAINAEIEKQLDALGIIYNRLGGSDRFDTAIKIADNYFKDSKTALIASGLKMPDALVGGYFGKNKDAPILLTYPESLELKTKKHLNNNYDFSYILGGSKVVSHKTYNGLGKILVD